MGYKLKRILIYPDGVTEKQVRPSGWKPGANTLLYLPMNSTDTYLDKSGNNVQTTNSGATFGTYQGVDCGIFNKTSIGVNPFALPINKTILVYAYCTSIYPSDADGKMFDARNNNVLALIAESNYLNNNKGYIFYVGNNESSGLGPYRNQRVLIACSYGNSKGTMYIKGNGIDVSTSLNGSSSGTPTYMRIGNEYNNVAERYFIGGMSQFIVESKERTAQEIADYYNLTKRNYGL